MERPSCDSNSAKKSREEVKKQYEEVDRLVLQLKKKHGDRFQKVKLRVWGWMLASNLHDNFEEPPNITLFGGTPCKETEIAGKTIIISSNSSFICCYCH